MKRWNEKSFAHRLVANVQVEMAQEIYEIKARDNQFYKEWPHRNRFVKMVAPMLRAAARGALAEMLQRHDVAEEEKNEIYEALLLDATVPNEDRISVH